MILACGSKQMRGLDVAYGLHGIGLVGCMAWGSWSALTSQEL